MGNVVEVEVEETYDVVLLCSKCGEDLEIEKIEKPSWVYRTNEYTVYVKPHTCKTEE